MGVHVKKVAGEMVATGRQARSAKNRLARSRVSVPVSLSAVQLPAGCPANAKDIDELVHGESALEQLCALKSIGELPRLENNALGSDQSRVQRVR